jgi:tetratricopeptide (TPR) repeat protein
MGAAGRAISLTEDSAIVHIARSWAYRVQNPPDIDAAQSDLLYAQKLAPYDFELLVALARFYTDYRPERIIEAELSSNYALQWARNDLERARALYALGHVYLAQNRKAEAKKVLTEAADLTTYQGQVLLFGVVEDLDRALAP